MKKGYEFQSIFDFGPPKITLKMSHIPPTSSIPPNANAKAKAKANVYMCV